MEFSVFFREVGMKDGAVLVGTNILYKEKIRIKK